MFEQTEGAAQGEDSFGLEVGFEKLQKQATWSLRFWQLSVEVCGDQVEGSQDDARGRAMEPKAGVSCLAGLEAGAVRQDSQAKE